VRIGFHRGLAQSRQTISGLASHRARNGAAHGNAAGQSRYTAAAMPSANRLMKLTRATNAGARPLLFHLAICAGVHSSSLRLLTRRRYQTRAIASAARTAWCGMRAVSAIDRRKPCRSSPQASRRDAGLVVAQVKN